MLNQRNLQKSVEIVTRLIKEERSLELIITILAIVWGQ